MQIFSISKKMIGLKRRRVGEIESELDGMHLSRLYLVGQSYQVNI